MALRKPMPDAKVVRELLDYSPETGEMVWKERSIEHFPDERAQKIWNARFSNKTALCTVAHNGYLYGSIFGENFSAHRIAWLYVTGEEPVEIDHINGDRSDNRFENLRDVDRTNNCRNTALGKRNSSGVVGVSWNKGMKAWDVRVRHARVGYFKNFEEAVAARVAAEAGTFHPNHGRKAVLTQEA